jgi:transcriptional regulator with XRE-family HTH domain
MIIRIKKLKQPPGNQRGVTPTTVVLGQRVRALRMERRMSQEVLANHLGVTFQQVQKYEKGVNRISTDRLILIASALNTSVEHIVGNLSGAEHQPSPIDTFMSTRDGVDIAEAMIKLVPNVRRSLIQLARKLGGEAEA